MSPAVGGRMNGHERFKRTFAKHEPNAPTAQHTHCSSNRAVRVGSGGAGRTRMGYRLVAALCRSS